MSLGNPGNKVGAQDLLGLFFIFKKSCVPFPLDLLALDQSKTFYKPDWFDIVGAEVKCCKEAVCVIDMSSFTKFEISVGVGNPLRMRRSLPLSRSCDVVS